MDVAIIGPKATPVNLAEFKKPMVAPLGSLRNREKVNGMVTAMNPVWIIRITVKSMIPLLKASKA